MNRACRTCEFFLYLGVTRISEEGMDLAVGKCRIQPPAMNDEGLASWPIVNGLDWCGEYRKRRA